MSYDHQHRSIPYEGITGELARQEQQKPSVIAFVDSLDAEQQLRFNEIAHNLVFIGYEEACKRTEAPKQHEDTLADLKRNYSIFRSGILFGIGRILNDN